MLNWSLLIVFQFPLVTCCLGCVHRSSHWLWHCVLYRFSSCGMHFPLRTHTCTLLGTLPQHAVILLSRLDAFIHPPSILTHFVLACTYYLSHVVSFVTSLFLPLLNLSFRLIWLTHYIIGSHPSPTVLLDTPCSFGWIHSTW